MHPILVYNFGVYNMIEITDNNFNDTIKENKVTVVDFWATWCGPCRALSPLIDKLEKEFSNITFCKANVEEAEEFAEQFGVQNLPCVIFFKDGKEINRVVGNNQAKIREVIESL